MWRALSVRLAVTVAGRNPSAHSADTPIIPDRTKDKSHVHQLRTDFGAKGGSVHDTGQFYCHLLKVHEMDRRGGL